MPVDICIQNACLTAIRYPENCQVINFPNDWDLFVLTFRYPDGSETTLRQAEFSIKEILGPYSLAFERELGGVGRIYIRLDIEPKDPEVFMVLDIKNDSDLCLTTVDFPRLPVAGITPHHALYLSTPWGSRNYDPVVFLREHHGGEVYRRYPADLAMQYNMVSDDNETYYLSAYHLGDETFDVWCSILSEDSLVLWNRWYPYIRQGQWTTPGNSIALLKGDWHSGADLYRERMAGNFHPPTPNEWLRHNFHGWMQVGLKMEGKPAEYRFTDIPALYDRAAEVGITVLHVYGWCGRGFDTMYPDYDINLDLGTESEFREAMDAVKSRGGRVEIYTNGRLIDPESYFATSVCPNCEVIAENGSRPTEQYGTSVVFHIACPSAKGYREYFKTQIERIVSRFHAHACQIDQVSCNPAFLCFSEKHGHSKPSNNWIPGTEEFLLELRELYHSINPEFFVWVEGMHERFAQYYDINQGHGESTPWNIGKPFPEQFKYTYPSYLITGLCTNIESLCHTCIQGKPFDFGIKSLEDEAFKKLLADLVAVRKAEAEYFMEGRFMDTVGIVVESESVEARAIRGSRGTLINLWSRAPVATNEVFISGEATNGVPRVIYPKDVRVLKHSPGYLICWSGPVASVAWERQIGT